MPSDRGNILQFPRRGRGREIVDASFVSCIIEVWSLASETGVLLLTLNLMIFESSLFAMRDFSMELRNSLYKHPK